MKSGSMKMVLAGLFLVVFTASASAEQLNYHFNESSSPAQDFSGNNFDGDWNGGLTSGVDGAKTFNDDKAYSFDGTDDYVNGSDQKEFSIWESGDTAALVLWLKPQAETDSMKPVGNGEYIVTLKDDTSSNGYLRPRFDVFGDNTGSTAGEIVPTNEWTMLTFNLDAGNSIEIWKNDTKVGTYSTTDTSSDSGNALILGDSGGGNYFEGDMDEIKIYHKQLSSSEISKLYNENSLNSPASIDLKTHKPQPSKLGDTISYTANASDSDGDDLNAWLTVEYWNNGTDLYTDKPMNEPSTNDFKLENLHDVTVTDDGYNATFTVSDGSVNTTAKENFYIEDNAPGVNLKQPKNKTYFDYDTNYKFKVTDNDDEPGEEWSCDIKKDGTVEDSTFIKEGVNNTYSKILRTGLRSHLAEAVCTDSSGNTGSASEHYSVDQFKENGIFAQNQVYETVKEYFDLDAKYGDMVQEAAITLYYDSKNVSMKIIQPSGVTTTSERQYHEIPLVTNNASSHSYSFTVNINQSDFTSGYETATENSSTGSQTVWKSLFLENQTTDRSKYAGGDNIYYTAYLRNKTSKIEFSKKDLVYNQTSTTYTVTIKNRPEPELAKYTVKVDSNSINSSKEAVALNPDYQASFNSQTRKVNAATIELTLEQLDLSLCSNSNGDKALIFNTYKETDRSVSLKSELDYAIQYWNPDYPDNKKVLNGSNSGTSTHEFCLEPGYASAKVDSTKKLIQYTDTKDDYVLRSYFLINQTVKGGNPARIPLYMLAKNKSSRVKFTVEDENRNALSGIVIRAERYFPDVDKQLPVAMVKTGAEGQTETFLQVNEIYYGFKIYRDGKLVKDVPQQVIPSDLELLFTLGDDDDAGYYDYEGQVGHTCDANATQVTCSYSSETEALEEITLKVEQDKPIGWKTLNKSSLSTSSGELTIKGFNATSSRIRYELEASFSDGVSIVLESDEIGLKSKPFGETGLMLSFFLFMTMSFAGLWKPSASILLGTFSLVISSFLPFLAVTQTALTALVALGAVIIWRMTD